MIVAWYSFDETSGNFYNKIGPGNLTLTSPSIFKNDGKVGGCFNTTNHSGYAYSSENGIANVIKKGAYSISFWWNPQATTLSQPWGDIFSLADTFDGTKKWRIEHKEDAYNNPVGTIDVDWFAGLQVWFINSSNVSVGNVFSYITPAKKWYHITITCDGTTINFYKDGFLISSEATTIDHGKLTGNEIFRIGFGSHSDYIDDVRVYDSVLSLKEIKEVARAKILHYDFTAFNKQGCNLLASPKSLSTNWTSYTNGYSGFYTDEGAEVVRIIDKAPDCGLQRNITLPSTGVYYFSVYAKPIARESTAVVAMKVSGVTASPQIAYGAWENLGTFQRLSIAINCTSTTGTIYLTPDGVGTISCEYTKPQVEKDQLSDFTGNTEIGFVSDASGYFNDGEFVTNIPKINEYDFGRAIKFFNNPKPASSYMIRSKKTVYMPEDFTLMYKVRALNTNQNGDNIYPVGWLGKLCSLGPSGSTERIGLLYKDTVSTNAVKSQATASFTNSWVNIAITVSGVSLKVYIGGSLVYTDTIGSIYFKNTYEKFYIGSAYAENYGGMTGEITDIRVYATALSEADIYEICKSRMEINKENVLFSKSLQESGYYKPSLVDYSTWVYGTTGSQAGFSANGTASENFIVKRQNPYGVEDIMWACGNTDAASDADGGWNSASFNIDRTKKYRFSCWYYVDDVSDGTTYFGCGGSTVNGITDSLLGTDPYFYVSNSANTLIAGKWTLWIGYVYPNTYSLTTGESGVYDLRGNKIIDITSFKWTSTTTISSTRGYLYCSTDKSKRQYMYRPRVDVCDGTEPSIKSLINLSENPNLITKNNVYGVGIKTKFNTFNDIGPVNNLAVYYDEKGYTNKWRDYSFNKLDTNTSTNYLYKNGVFIETPITVPFNNSLRPSKITIFGSVYCDNLLPNLTGQSRYILSNAASSGGYDVLLDSSGFYFKLYANSILRQVFVQRSVITSDVNSPIYFNFCFTFDGRYLVAYINGVQKNITDCGSSSNNITYVANNNFIIGGKALSAGGYEQDANYYWSDYIKAIRIYNTVLTPTEIRTLSEIGNVSIIDKGILYTKKIIEE